MALSSEMSLSEDSHSFLRSYLKREVDPARVWEAIERALEGQNESARVSASKLLFDALYEPSSDTWPVCTEREANAEQVQAKLIDLLSRHASTPT
jgi:hypothetical protein